MYKIYYKEILNKNVTLFKIFAPQIAKKALPGQFIILRVDEQGERVPLTIAETDQIEGTVTIVVQTIGDTTAKLGQLSEGDVLLDFVGPLGIPTHIENSVKKVAVVGGGVGCAIAFPQAKFLHNIGIEVDIIAGFRNKDIVILEEKMKKNSSNLYITTDDGSYGEKGFVTDKLRSLIEDNGNYDLVIAIGPIPMMKFVSQLTKDYNIKTIVSLNPIMIDGTGMCGCCRVTVNNEVKFACVDGPDFDGHSVDYDELMKRNAIYNNTHKKDHECNLHKKADKFLEKNCEVEVEINIKDKFERNMSPTKVIMPEQIPTIRNKNFEEVTFGYTSEMAIEEARRCLDCKHKPCVANCPVNVRIPEFISKIAIGDFMKAYEIIVSTNSLPAVCGRVCPQETQCEQKCVRGIKGESVGIGRLERFIADWYRNNVSPSITRPKSNGKKIAILGAGPSGLTCANDLAKLGYDVTIFEAFHKAGGVLVYGIPEFRLPKSIVDNEVNTLKQLGVKIKLNTVVGRTVEIDELKSQGFVAIYIATGAGLPSFMRIEGEGLAGVYSANEYLTRVTLMKAHENNSDTPIQNASKIAVIGGGNVAMDAARCAKRVGADVSIIYRRDKDSMPARYEEIHHAEEEEINFNLLTNPVRIIGDANNRVTGIECVKMALGEPDESGRRRPEVIENSNFVINVDAVIISIGTSPNPTISKTTKNLNTDSRGCIVVDEFGRTTVENVYAGGDATIGAATVIHAMGAGKLVAKTIDKDLTNK